MTEMGWQLQRIPDGSAVAQADGFLMKCFDIIGNVRNTMLLEARSKR